MSSPSSPESVLRFRNAVPENDDDLLFSLFRDARSGDFASLGWDEERLNALLLHQFQLQQQDYLANYPNSIRRLALLRGKTVGLMWLDYRPSEIRLLDFIVALSHRGQGIGTCLLQGLQNEAAHTGLPLRHMVAAYNPRARSLYDRLGFRVIGDAGSHHLMEWLPAGATGSEAGG